ncbi:hypothetical protein ACJZ2D_013854 [Fusarium nematophilum]
MGFVVSALTLADALVKLARFGSMIKDAPGVWREYSSALDGIVSAGIDAVSQNLPVSNLTVEVEGQQQNLIKLCNRNVDKWKKARGVRRGERRWNWPWTRLRFVVKEDRIAGLLRTVQCTKSTLILALEIAAIEGADIRHQVMEAAVQDLKKRIAAQSKSLKEIWKASRRRRRARTACGMPSPSQPSSPHYRPLSSNSRRLSSEAGTLSAVSASFLMPEPETRDDNTEQVDEGSNDESLSEASQLPLSSGANSTTNNSEPTQSTDETNSDGYLSDSDIQTISSAAESAVSEPPELPIVNILWQLNVVMHGIFLPDRCARRTTGDFVFCIENFSHGPFGQVSTLKEPCTIAPCEHSTIQGLQDLPVGEPLPGGYPVQIRQVLVGRKRNFEDFNPLSGYNANLVEKCLGGCSHTKVGNVGSRRMKRMLAIYFKASLSRPTSDTVSAFRSSGSEDSDDDNEAHQEDGFSAPGFDESLLGFKSLTCFFCRDEALTPRTHGSAIVDLILYGSNSYGYTCRRCNKSSWITGTRWIWS